MHNVVYDSILAFVFDNMIMKNFTLAKNSYLFGIKLIIKYTFPIPI